MKKKIVTTYIISYQYLYFTLIFLLFSISLKVSSRQMSTMTEKILFLFIFVILFNTISCLQYNLKVSIYYESLCQDSTKFLVDQFKPAYPILSKYINVDFIPYGKADVRKLIVKYFFYFPSCN